MALAKAKLTSPASLDWSLLRVSWGGVLIAATPRSGRHTEQL